MKTKRINTPPVSPAPVPQQDPVGYTSPPLPTAGSLWFLTVSLLTILALTLAIYGHTLDYPLNFDDRTYLLENPLIKDIPSLNFWLQPKLFAALPFKMALFADVSTNMMLRPFAYFTFHLNQLASGNAPAGFRLVNIAIHGANGCLLFLILRHILRYSRLPRLMNPESSLFIPLVSALLFVAHPLQIESVTYVIQRFTSMAGFFFLLTIWIHLVAGETEGVKARRCLRAASVLLAVLGMLTKEDVFMMPAMAVLLDWLLLGNTLKTVLRRSWPLLCCMLIVPSLVLFVTWAQSNGGVSLNAAVNIANGRTPIDGQPAYLLNEFRVILLYLKLLLVPQGLNVDPDIRPAESIFHWHILLSGFGILTIIGTAWGVYRRVGTDLRAALIFVFTLWFFGIISISSGIAPLPDLMAEHRTYLPSMGAIIVLVCVLDMGRTRGATHHAWKYTIPAAAALWIGVLAYAAIERNEVWSTRRSLWEDSISKSPNKARPYINLGACHGEEGRLEPAEACFRKGLSLDPGMLPAYENLSTVLTQQSKLNEVRELCEKALSIGVDTYKIRYNLGVALFNTGRQDEGIASLRLALERYNGSSLIYYTLGQALSQKMQPHQALACFRRAAELGADIPQLAQTILELENQTQSQTPDNLPQ